MLKNLEKLRIWRISRLHFWSKSFMDVCYGLMKQRKEKYSRSRKIVNRNLIFIKKN